MKRIYLIIILLYLLVSCYYLPVNAFTGGAKTELVASIPAVNYYRIYGYTAPSSIVQATAVRTFAQGTSDNTGYFLLEDVPIAPEAQEICLTTIDSDRRIGFPLCLSAFSGQYPGEIGPIILSPTISVSQSLIWQNQAVFASGKTIPNEEIIVSLFEVPSDTVVNKLGRIFSSEVYAADLPTIYTRSDSKGEFSLTLPTAKAVGYRMFARAYYKDNPTPKSQTLSFAINPLFSYFLRYILPKLILIVIGLAVIAGIIIYDLRSKKVRQFLSQFIEKQLQPTAVRLSLALRRQWYNFRQFGRLNRK